MPHLSRTCDDANPMLRVESQGESMPRLPYVCRPIVLAVVLAVTATAPHLHWRPTTYPRGVAVSTRPTTSEDAPPRSSRGGALVRGQGR